MPDAVEAEAIRFLKEVCLPGQVPFDLARIFARGKYTAIKNEVERWEHDRHGRPNVSDNFEARWKGQVAGHEATIRGRKIASPDNPWSFSSVMFQVYTADVEFDVFTERLPLSVEKNGDVISGAPRMTQYTVRRNGVSRTIRERYVPEYGNLQHYSLWPDDPQLDVDITGRRFYGDPERRLSFDITCGSPRPRRKHPHDDP